MSAADRDFWVTFAELEARRSIARKRHDAAYRSLDPQVANERDGVALSTWRAYCESVEQLERSLQELERLIWQLHE